MLTAPVISASIAANKQSYRSSGAPFTLPKLRALQLHHTIISIRIHHVDTINPIVDMSNAILPRSGDQSGSCFRRGPSVSLVWFLPSCVHATVDSDIHRPVSSWKRMLSSFRRETNPDSTSCTGWLCQVFSVSSIGVH